MANFNAVRVTVNISKDTLEELKRLAVIRRQTVTQALHQAIVTECFFEDEIRKGAKVLLELPDGKFRQVLFPGCVVVK